MEAYIMDNTETKAIFSILVLDVVSVPDEAELNLKLSKKQRAFKVIRIVNGFHYLKRIDNVSDYYCPDKSYMAFIDEIYDWDGLRFLLK